MPFIKLTDKIKELDGLIDSCNTGSASDLANALDISPNILQSLLDRLRSEGSVIAYCNERVTYYYKKRSSIITERRFPESRGRLASPFQSAQHRSNCPTLQSYWTDGQLG